MSVLDYFFNDLDDVSALDDFSNDIDEISALELSVTI